ncbi:glyoxylate/hydroxypyruvate reductase A [Pseudomonas sp. dw_358]|uniref:2-hydroxyacid dehydrogenase n=1 Tax=Pseudomonas sp. dw_358 TaxID=2720083 RepID=UPI001BD6D9AE|nr:glyoxylate/hydroxypyruvate reductase A [Pseudomonas sp. dw_358]
MNAASHARPIHIYFNSDIDSAEEWREALTVQLPNLRFTVGPECEAPESVDVALVWKLPARGMSEFTHLKAILSLGAGINQLSPERLPEGVPIARLVDDSLTATMIEYAKAATFRFHRRFHEYENLSRLGIWQFTPPVTAQETTVGVLGLGALGMAIAQSLADEGFNVYGWSSSAKSSADIQCLSGTEGLSQLAAVSNIIINVLPLTPDTAGLLNASFFEMCKQIPCIVNMGRGDHLVEADLLEALKRNRVGAATLDVASVEPLPQDSLLWNNHQILLTPHVAGISTPKTAVINVAANVLRAMAGNKLLNEVDRAKGY